MNVRIVLPVVIETEELRILRDIGKSPDTVRTKNSMFYNIDAIEDHEEFENFCYVWTGGARFEIGLSGEEVDKMIMDDIAPFTSGN